MPIISVIIPLYNKVERIRLCVESILAQTFSDFELIVVDDGSSDGSSDIIEQLAMSNHRIRVVHQQNGGVSSARNKGIDLSNGNWLCFIDADDTIEPEFLQNLMDNGTEYDDIISESPNKTYRWENEEIVNYIDTEGRLLSGTVVWGKLYNSNLVKDHNLKFDTHLRFGEDTEFNLTLFQFCKSIKTVKSTYYNYYQDGVKSWELSEEEIRTKISNLRIKYNNINNIFHSNLSPERDINIILSLYYFDEMLHDMNKYFTLYKEFYPKAEKKDLYNDMYCSPLIRGITVAKRQIKVNPNKVRLLLYDLSATYGINFLKIKYPYRSHKIIGILLGLRLPLYAYNLIRYMKE